MPATQTRNISISVLPRMRGPSMRERRTFSCNAVSLAISSGFILHTLVPHPARCFTLNRARSASAMFSSISPNVSTVLSFTPSVVLRMIITASPARNERKVGSCKPTRTCSKFIVRKSSRISLGILEIGVVMQPERKTSKISNGLKRDNVNVIMKPWRLWRDMNGCRIQVSEAEAIRPPANLQGEHYRNIMPRPRGSREC
ncbi:hypothetical protein AGR3A_Cc170173 [Agrobacterium tomkonis CFBP 6623]|uniref:Uncharacterized protein n=1 Tax=Agrobacterium tomkonis CFBP 6623 TaxID=1183432 RepID=A0A1S7NW12_9HYPH|nr:hypothetical protein AGR3A_Cc170173 [Agrobacterium tomkonis CFBP 6623]